jgi:hypothetical protein
MPKKQKGTDKKVKKKKDKKNPKGGKVKKKKINGRKKRY